MRDLLPIVDALNQSVCAPYEGYAQALHAINDELKRLRRIEAACRQEHGGKRDEAECPICEALRPSVPTSDGRTP